jgi:hypothetical protein
MFVHLLHLMFFQNIKRGTCHVHLKHQVCKIRFFASFEIENKFLVSACFSQSVKGDWCFFRQRLAKVASKDDDFNGREQQKAFVGVRFVVLNFEAKNRVLCIRFGFLFVHFLIDVLFIGSLVSVLSSQNLLVQVASFSCWQRNTEPMSYLQNTDISANRCLLETKVLLLETWDICLRHRRWQITRILFKPPLDI